MEHGARYVSFYQNGVFYFNDLSDKTYEKKMLTHAMPILKPEPPKE